MLLSLHTFNSVRPTGVISSAFYSATRAAAQADRRLFRPAPPTAPTSSGRSPHRAESPPEHHRPASVSAGASHLHHIIRAVDRAGRKSAFPQTVTPTRPATRAAAQADRRLFRPAPPTAPTSSGRSTMRAESPPFPQTVTLARSATRAAAQADRRLFRPAPPTAPTSSGRSPHRAESPPENHSPPEYLSARRA